MTHQQINMIINLISWFSFLCRCFFNMFDIIESMSFQRLYELHRKSFLNCSWFVQSNETLQRQSTMQTLQQQQQQQIIQQQQVIQQQQIEKVFRLIVEVFDCRRCSVNFVNNTKLHQHIRDRHAKRSKTFTTFIFISFVTLSNTSITRLIFTSKLFAVFSSWKVIANIIRISSSSYSCLINHVTRFIFITSSKSYFIVKDLHHMFHTKFKSASRFVMIIYLFFVSLFDMFFVMFLRQTYIISYFKSIDYSTSSSSRKINSMRKYVDSKFECQSIRINHLTMISLFISRFVNNFNNHFSFWSHRSSFFDRKDCMKKSQYCCFHKMM